MCSIMGVYGEGSSARGPDARLCADEIARAGRVAHAGNAGGLALFPPPCDHGPDGIRHAAVHARRLERRLQRRAVRLPRDAGALAEKGYAFESDSDCEILLPLYREYGVDMFAMLDAEFAMILYDAETGGFLAARDPIGIRPLYYGYSASGHIMFASEPKNLVGLCAKIMPFPPGHYYKDGAFVCYCDIAAVDAVCRDDMETVCRNIREKLVRGIEKRLDADAPVGFLLSGGLDSSLVCAVAAKCLQKPIRTFAIGMRADAIDLKYAREVADYIHSDHTEIIITEDDVLENLETVIRLLGTFDITTIRASMGMYLICKAIRAQTDIRVLLTGEISDELFGYKYTDFAPSAEAFQQEAESACASCTCTTCSAPTGASRSTGSRRASRSATSTSCTMSWRSTRR